jgi:predicted dithiol-disulfide oxidoreductase (DUF899 family)
MSDSDTAAKLARYRRQIAELRAKIREAQAAAEPEEVRDDELATAEKPVLLSQLFGDKDDLFVIHNMGSTCPHCTLWADGFNGIYHHLANRAGFVVSSPDPPALQRQFAASRGWRFPMVSHQGTSFAADMGYRAGDGGWLPGISVLKRDRAAGQSRIVRVSHAGFSPGDDFCTLWHILDLLPEGAGGWEAKFAYP